MAQDYECIHVRMKKGDFYELFIRKIDGMLRLIGHRPPGYERVNGFSDEECTRYNIADIILPKGESELTPLLYGQSLGVKHTIGIPTIFDGCIYVNRKDVRKKNLEGEAISDVVSSEDAI